MITPNAPNFRDFGGYRTADGREVRRGCLFRSSELTRLTSEEWQQLAALNVRLIIDLRLIQERERRNSQVIPGIRLLSADVLAGAGIVHDGLPSGGWARVAEGDAVGVMQDLYRGFISDEHARVAYRDVLHALLESEGATIVNCVAGQDRTGWAVATILTVLGVPWETVVGDYLISARAMSAKHSAHIKKDAARRADLGVTEENVAPLYWVNESYLEAACEQVERQYGSFPQYLRTGLELTDPALDELRARYLLPAK